MNTLDRVDSINGDCVNEIEPAEKIYLERLRDAEAIKHNAWLHFNKAKEKAIAKRDKLIAEFQKEIDNATSIH